MKWTIWQVGIFLLAATVIGIEADAADLEAGRKKAEVCAACHGPDGNATIPGTPSLAGQPVYFTHWQLIKFRDGRRKDPQMTPFAKNLSDGDMADLAAYYEAQQPKPRRPASSAATGSRASVARRPKSLTARDVPVKIPNPFSKTADSPRRKSSRCRPQASFLRRESSGTTYLTR
jgi:cytochrome c553